MFYYTLVEIYRNNLFKYFYLNLLLSNLWLKVDMNSLLKTFIVFLAVIFMFGWVFVFYLLFTKLGNLQWIVIVFAFLSFSDRRSGFFKVLFLFYKGFSIFTWHLNRDILSDLSSGLCLLCSHPLRFYYFFEPLSIFAAIWLLTLILGIPSWYFFILWYWHWHF